MESISRRDVGYTIISRTEQILRHHISTQVSAVFSTFTHAVPPGLVKVATERNDGNEVTVIDEILENLDFPHLKDIVFYKNNYDYFFDPELMQTERFSRLMEDLYTLRCKIAHIRGYFTSSDLDDLIEMSSALIRNIPNWISEFDSFLKSINESPHNHVCKPPIDFDSESIRIPNNIPTPDFEYEGGFIGRREDIQKIVDMLEGDLHRVITITGAGGVGKTALAVKILQEIFKKGSNKFDGIVWLSAKENKLTYLGIEDIEPTVKNFDQLLDTILEVMGFDTRDVPVEEKEEEVRELFNLYSCILVVVDNLETITDDKIIDFIVDAHPKSKFLITSRKGLGQVERRYELKELKEREAVLLFRHIARDKHLDKLASLDEDVLKKYVNKLSRYPLAIKWIIGHVKLGKEIDNIIGTIHEKTSDISLFCFEHIYADLGVNARNILCALSIFDGAPSSGVLMYVVNLKQQDFEDSIRELIIVSLVIPEQCKADNNNVVTKYALLPLTQGYVRNQLDKNTILKQQFDARLRTVETTIEEAERAKTQYKFSLRDLGATTEEEKIAAMLAHTAYQKSEAGRYEEAVEDYRRAANIAPNFGPLYRNWAIIESTEGHHMEADRLMEKASKLIPEDPILWLTWGNMKRKSDRIKDAMPLLEKAYLLSPDDPYILNALGNLKCRLGEHEQAHELLKRAVSLVPADSYSSKKHEIVNKSSIAENLKRWAEVLFREGNYSKAEEILIEALKTINEAQKLDRKDERTIAARHLIVTEMGYLYKELRNAERAITCFKDAFCNYPNKYKGIRDSILAGLELARLYVQAGKANEARTIIDDAFEKRMGKIRHEQDIKERYDWLKALIEGRENFVDGIVISANTEKKYVIIESVNATGDTYLGFHTEFNNIVAPIDHSIVGKKVTFIPNVRKDGNKYRKDALSISFSDRCTEMATTT